MENKKYEEIINSIIEFGIDVIAAENERRNRE